MVAVTLERFLYLAAQGSLPIVSITPPALYFGGQLPLTAQKRPSQASATETNLDTPWYRLLACPVPAPLMRATRIIKYSPPKLHYQNDELPFAPEKTRTYVSLTTKQARWISTNLTCSTSAKNSRITILNRGEPHTVGDTLHVEVAMYDFTNRRKLYGGDFLLARIFSPRLGAASSGVVTDLSNGVYDVRFTLFWPGDSRLAFTLVHSSEAVSVLDRVRETIPDKVTFLGTFVSGKSREVTSCHTFLNTTKQVCDYTDTHLNEPWTCEKPSKLPCSALLAIKSYNKYKNILSQEQTTLFKR
ncbi:NXPE family member 4-like [Lampetra fluviatilis]